MRRYVPQFTGQQDAQEFLSFLLDALSEDLNRIKTRKYVEKPEFESGLIGNDDAIDSFFERCKKWEGERRDSIIDDLFKGWLKLTYECEACQNMEVGFENFICLGVEPVRGADRRAELEKVFEKNFEERMLLEGDNEWFCKRCDGMRRAFLRQEIWEVPKYLIVHLKRFTRPGQQPFSPTGYPREGLSLDKWLKERGAMSWVGDLGAVVHHRYTTPNSGVYKAFVKGGDGSWREFNGKSGAHFLKPTANCDRFFCPCGGGGQRRGRWSVCAVLHAAGW